MPQRCHASSAGMDDGEVTRRRRGDVRRDEEVVKGRARCRRHVTESSGIEKGASVWLLGVVRD